MQVNHNMEARTVGSRMLTVEPTAAQARLANTTERYDTTEVNDKLRAVQRTQAYRQAVANRPELQDIPTVTPSNGGGTYGEDSPKTVTDTAALDRRTRWRRIVILVAIAFVLWYVLRKK